MNNIYNAVNPNNYVPCKERTGSRPTMRFQDQNPRLNKWNINNLVTKVFKTNMNSSLVPESEKAAVHRDGRHFKLAFPSAIRYDAVCDWISDELGFKCHHIDSVIFKSQKLFEIEAKNEIIATQIKDKIKELYENNELEYDVKIIEFTPVLTPLTVMGVPKIFPDSALQTLFMEKLKTKIVRSEADTVQKHKWSNGKRMYYVSTEALKQAEIPDTITWNNGEWIFYLSYPGQVKKCRKCGLVGHYARACTNKYDKMDAEQQHELDKHILNEKSSNDNAVENNDINKLNDLPGNPALESTRREVFDEESKELVNNNNETGNIKNKRLGSTPNKDEAAKKVAYGDNSLNDNSTAKQTRTTYNFLLPAGHIAPQIDVRKMCGNCGNREKVFEPSNGLYISSCEKCDPLSLKATTKCFEEACTISKTWNKLPYSGERVACKNSKCSTIKYVCGCGFFHSVNTSNVSYVCDKCYESVDPPLG